MPRRTRIHVENGYYYITQESNEPIFANAEDYRAFCAILSRIRRTYGARVHGFCLLPYSFHLVVEVGTVPASRIVQRLGTLYLHSVRRRGRSPFRHRRHRQVLVSRDFLLRLLRYLHSLPVLHGYAEKPWRHKWSSNAGYARRSVFPWLVTRTLRRLSVRPARARAKYRAMMRELPPRLDVLLFERGSLRDPRIVGGFGSQSEQPARRRGESMSELMGEAR